MVVEKRSWKKWLGKKVKKKIADGEKADEDNGKNNNITSNFSMTKNIFVRNFLDAYWI